MSAVAAAVAAALSRNIRDSLLTSLSEHSKNGVRQHEGSRLRRGTSSEHAPESNSQPRKFSVKSVPIPKINDDEVLLKGMYHEIRAPLTGSHHLRLLWHRREYMQLFNGTRKRELTARDTSTRVTSTPSSL